MIARRTPLKRHTRIKRVSTKRAKQLRKYSVRQKAFLKAHPYRQVWLKEHGCTEREAIAGRGFVAFTREVGGLSVLLDCPVPISEEVHHVNKRRGLRLLDETYWLAVSCASHDRIENNKAWARERGYLARF